MGEPISIDEAREHLRIDGADRDGDLARYIADAREWVEAYTGILLVERSVTETFRVPGRFVTLRAWPIAPDAVVTADVGGVVVEATLDTAARPARVLPVGRCWPSHSPDQVLSVTVTAGLRSGDEIPGNFRRAMLVLIGAYDADREGGDIFATAERTAKSLCRSKRLARL